MLLKRSISLFLAMILITQPITVLGSENANSSDVLLTVDAQVFSAVVPTQLPVWMSASGVITVAEDVNITNTSKGPIRVDNIELANVKADWELVNFDSDFSSFKVGSKKLAMSFNGDKSLISGDIPLGASNLTPIDGLGSMPLNYDAKIPAQSTGLVDEIPANVVFTLKWHEVGSADIEENNPNIYEFVPADTKVLTINFKGVTSDTVTWNSSDEAVATVADHVSKGRARPIDGSKQCIVTAVGSGKAIITGVLGDGTANSFEVVVADRAITSLEVTKTPDKLAYIEGENFNAAGMIVTVNYNNGTNVDISDYVIADGNNLIMGQDSVAINYNGKSATQPISVVEKSLTSITITNPPNKTSYVEGNSFDATGMVITAYYDNGTNKIVVPTLSKNTTLVVGQTDVDVSYGGQTTAQNIVVEPKSIDNIVITTPPTKTSYIEGNSFDVIGMIVTANYNNGTTSVVDPVLGRNINLITGQTSVDVSFGGMTVAQPISVAAKTLTGIAITTQPTKKAYIEGNNFDSTGMVVTATYNNDSTAVVVPTFSRHTNLTVGQTSIDVSFGGMTVSQPISVAAKTLTSIAITTQPTKKAYIEANNFNSSGMVVTAYYNNGTTGVVTPTFGRNTNLTVGQTTVDVSFGGKTVDQAITVVSKTLTSIAITTQPNKKAYIEGNSFDSAGMVVTAYYNNGTNSVISPTFGRYTNLTTGQLTVDVSFGGKTVAQAITVVSKTLTSIDITNPPSKTAYIEGNSFDKVGMVVTAYYNNGTTEVITPTFAKHTNLTVGQTSVDVSFGGKTVTQAITVATKTLTSIAITTQPTKKAYIEANNFDSAGMVVTATYNNGTTNIVTPILGRHTNLTIGQKNIDVSFGGKTVTQAITVVAKSLTSIAITTQPNKKSYIEANNFDSTGMIVTATYNNGTTGIVVPTFAKHINLTVGQTSVDVSFGGKTVTQAITVSAKSLTSIAITTAPSQTAYIEANNFNSSGMVVTAYYNNGTSNIISPTLSRNTNLTTGQTTVDISFGGKTITQAITVAAKTLTSISITTQPTKKAYIEGNAFDKTGMVVTATYNNGTTAVVTPTLGRHTNLTIGQANVDIKFGGKTITQSISVSAKTLTSITITTQATKKAYVQGHNFDTTGMVVTATYNNGTTAVVTPTLGRHTNLEVGQTGVDVKFGGKTIVHTITVRSIALGDKYVVGNYEYSYNQYQDFNQNWKDDTYMDGFGVRVVDNSQTDYASPLTTIQGYPVVDMSSLFAYNPNKTLNLINWNTSNVTMMTEMFSPNQATSINGLQNFNTSKVLGMRGMFEISQVTNLDLSSFNVFNVIETNNMFAGSKIKNLKVYGYDELYKFSSSKGFPTGITITPITNN